METLAVKGHKDRKNEQPSLSSDHEGCCFMEVMLCGRPVKRKQV